MTRVHAHAIYRLILIPCSQGLTQPVSVHLGTISEDCSISYMRSKNGTRCTVHDTRKRVLMFRASSCAKSSARPTTKSAVAVKQLDPTSKYAYGSTLFEVCKQARYVPGVMAFEDPVPPRDRKSIARAHTEQTRQA
ncbi:hypothetical protein EDB89DRAFT_214305 [Lactarius sanguifluus]|nr:hypothetical protein EDB89DRAFT_214305 [Lactarius sanguifluus]